VIRSVVRKSQGGGACELGIDGYSCTLFIQLKVFAVRANAREPVSIPPKTTRKCGGGPLNLKFRPPPRLNCFPPATSIRNHSNPQPRKIKEEKNKKDSLPLAIVVVMFQGEEQSSDN